MPFRSPQICFKDLDLGTTDFLPHSCCYYMQGWKTALNSFQKLSSRFSSNAKASLLKQHVNNSNEYIRRSLLEHFQCCLATQTLAG